MGIPLNDVVATGPVFENVSRVCFFFCAYSCMYIKLNFKAVKTEPWKHLDWAQRKLSLEISLVLIKTFYTDPRPKIDKVLQERKDLHFTAQSQK